MPWEFSAALLFTTLWNYFFMKWECSKTYLSQGYKICALDHIGSLSMQQTIHSLAGLSLLYGSTCPLKVVYHHAIFHTTCLATAQPATSLTGLTAKDCGKCMSGLPTDCHELRIVRQLAVWGVIQHNAWQICCSVVWIIAQSRKNNFYFSQR